MRIAIPTTQGVLCPHFGHCEQFAIMDIEGTTIIKTESLTPPPHEPGVLPAWLHSLGVTTIVCGGMGTRAQQLFAQNNIKVVYGAASMSPDDIVRQFLAGTLVSGENVCDH